jgi:hypothetical protein
VPAWIRFVAARRHLNPSEAIAQLLPFDVTLRVLVFAILAATRRSGVIYVGVSFGWERKSQGMTHCPQTDRELDRTARRLSRSGRPFIGGGIAIALVGVGLMVLGDDQIAALGIAIAGFALAPLLLGLAMVLAGLVSWWAARHKPFA